ncbi:hypothetical protein ACH196_34720 [Mesorhizobium sp. IMUNJ23232]
MSIFNFAPFELVLDRLANKRRHTVLADDRLNPSTDIRRETYARQLRIRISVQWRSAHPARIIRRHMSQSNLRGKADGHGSICTCE